MATRTLAFQVSEELFQRVKAYLARYEEIHHRRLSQKEFVIGLIEAELDEADEEFAAAEAAAATENLEVEQAAEEPEKDDPADEDTLPTDEDAPDESEPEQTEDDSEQAEAYAGQIGVWCGMAMSQQQRFWRPAIPESAVHYRIS